VTHVQVENVSSRVRDGMEALFDTNRPYFEAWVNLYDADRYSFGQGRASHARGARQVYYAALCGFHEIVDHLTDAYPLCAGASGGRCGTALHAASFAGHLQLVQSLHQHGVFVDVPNYAGDAPLRFASQSGHCDVVQYLISHGADVNSRGEGQNTPLNWAAHGGHVDVVQVLLDNGADVRTTDDHGRTPLHDAIWGDDPKGDFPQVVQLLLAHGANVNAQDSHYRTPLHLVPMRPTKIEVLRILLEHGADMDAKDNKRRTPLEVLMPGHGEIARLLSEYSSRRAQT
jgi:ankyrin repeat protein